MSPVRSPHITSKQPAASQPNANLSHGPSPYGRAPEIVPSSFHNMLLPSIEESHFGQVWPITHLLMQAKRRHNVDATGNESETICTVLNGDVQKRC